MQIRLVSVVRRLKLQIFHITFWLVAYQNAWSIFQGTHSFKLFGMWYSNQPPHLENMNFVIQN